MSNRSRFVRRQYRSPEGRRAPQHYTPDELHRFLVDDAIKGHPTEIRWATAAYMRIAKQRRQHPDAAFEAVRAEVVASGKFMPGMA